MSRLLRSITFAAAAVVAVPFSLVACSVGGAQEYGEVPQTYSYGHQVFVEHCQQCHGLPDPRRHTDDDWPRTLDRMAEKAKLDYGDRSDLQNFLCWANDQNKKP